MKFTAGNGLWWTVAADDPDRSPDDCRLITRVSGLWLPLLGLGGILTALVFTAWRFEPAAVDARAGGNNLKSTRGDFHQWPAVRVRLRADAAGRLASITLNDRPVHGTDELRSQIRGFFGPGLDATVEVELDCDGHLRYEETQGTIEAVSTCVGPDGRPVPLVNRVVFAPRRSGRP